MSQPKSVKRASRWNEEVEEGTCLHCAAGANYSCDVAPPLPVPSLAFSARTHSLQVPAGGLSRREGLHLHPESRFCEGALHRDIMHVNAHTVTAAWMVPHAIIAATSSCSSLASSAKIPLFRNCITVSLFCNKTPCSRRFGVYLYVSLLLCYPV